MRRIVVGIVLMASVGCRTGGAGVDSAVKAQGGEPLPGSPASVGNGDVWSCPATAPGGAGFAIRDWAGIGSMRGFLTGPATLVYNCGKAPPATAVDPSGATPQWLCTLAPGQTNAALFAVVPLRLASGGDVVHVTSAAGFDVTLACIDGNQAPAVIPTFAELAPILDAKCAGCHADGAQEPKLETLADWTSARSGATVAVATRFMPYHQKTWLDTPDGKRVLTWLKFGKDFTTTP